MLSGINLVNVHESIYLGLSHGIVLKNKYYLTNAFKVQVNSNMGGVSLSVCVVYPYVIIRMSLDSILNVLMQEFSSIRYPGL
jgi:hypothetical protein